MDKRLFYLLLTLFFIVGMFTGLSAYYIYNTITLPGVFNNISITSYELGKTDGFNCAKEQCMAILENLFKEVEK